MDRYSYIGPVMEFDRCVDYKWEGETVAVSEKKAKSNLIFQWKKAHGRTPGAKISLPGNLEIV